MRAILVVALVVGLGPIDVKPFQPHTVQTTFVTAAGPAATSATGQQGAGAPGTATPSAQAAPPTCDAAEHRQFDFWLGEWDVTGPNGQAAGRNSITRELNGCVLHEHWTGATGPRGESFNIWDRTRKRWHQTWVSDTGNLLVLEGGLVNGAMRMTGDTMSPKGPVRNRITWTPASDGSVRQFWETSIDDGKTWQIAFDGRYRRAK
jgi:hypothetical protein